MDQSSNSVVTSPPLHLYLTGFHHHNRHVRLAVMSGMFHVMCLRSMALFKRELLTVFSCMLFISYCCQLNVALILGLLLVAVHIWCWWQASLRVEHIRGHRAGAHGYSGQYCENTVEALKALTEEDNGPEGPIKDLHYVEIDIQETADGELVVMHDFKLAHPFPNTGPNVEAYQQLQEQGIRWPGTAASIRDLTMEQLRTLHIAGREGLHAPTLAEFIDAFQECKCRRPLIIEVKQLHTDQGRQRLLQLLRRHKPYADKLEQDHPEFRNPELGFLAVIAFPHFYARCFGEFGTKRWRYWTQQLARMGIPVRCCFLEVLSYCHGLGKDI